MAINAGYDSLLLASKMACADELVKLFFRISFHNKDILYRLAHQHSVVIGIMTLKRLC